MHEAFLVPSASEQSLKGWVEFWHADPWKRVKKRPTYPEWKYKERQRGEVRKELWQYSRKGRFGGAKLLLWWWMSTIQHLRYARLCATFFMCDTSLDLYYNPASKVRGNQGSERLNKWQSQNSELGPPTLEPKLAAVTPYWYSRSWRTMDPRLRIWFHGRWSELLGKWTQWNDMTQDVVFVLHSLCGLSDK